MPDDPQFYPLPRIAADDFASALLGALHLSPRSETLDL